MLYGENIITKSCVFIKYTDTLHYFGDPTPEEIVFLKMRRIGNDEECAYEITEEELKEKAKIIGEIDKDSFSYVVCYIKYKIENEK